jgi:nitroreductase
MSSNITDFISKRVSCPRLDEPVPSPAVLEKIISTSLRAPDHMMLRPWRYLIVRGQARERLGELFCEAALSDIPDLNQTQQEKYLSMPLRAPMMIIGVSTNQVHNKVPIEEQVISCGVGIGYMLLALQAEGFGGMWRTGPMADHAIVKQGLGIHTHETLVGFLYIGTPRGGCKSLPDIKVADYFQEWG